MASEPGRPPTRKGSGSRPPTSRFQEGSMNDRASAAPPPQFLGPEQLLEYERRFYTDPPSARYHGIGRPASATAQLQAITAYPQFGAEDHRVAHKKSTGFFGRVRDALFNRGGQQEQLRRKHSSLQEPLRQPSPPRPEYLHAGGARSEINIARMMPSPRGAADWPSKEEVEASYSQLMASGFFKSHAIQSTRHGPPKPAPEGQIRGVIKNQSVPNPPVRVSSINATTRSTSGSLKPPPKQSTPKRRSREFTGGRAAAAQRAARNSLSSLSSLFTPSIPDLRKKESRYTLRGRKRTRGDGEETPRTSTTDSQYSFASSTAILAQPLKRVAKKLRKTPSSNSTKTNNPPPPSTQPPPQTTADGIVRLEPSIYSGGSLYPNEHPVRLRSPSPRRPGTPMVHDHPRRPRKTFSYKLTEPVRTRERMRERAARRGRSFEETIIHVDEAESGASRREWERERSAAAITTAVTRSRAQMANKAPERWHGSGKAYHLKDRGSRPCGKENEGDVSRDQVAWDQQPHWYIGNAL